MNILWPILVIIIGAIAWWFLTYLQAPKPFFIALIAVLVVAFIIWILAVAGVGPQLYLNLD